jgi:hypothetical protein
MNAQGWREAHSDTFSSLEIISPLCLAIGLNELLAITFLSA